MTHPFMLLTVLFGTTIAFAQEHGIVWRTDPRQAVQEAQASNRPLMVYVLASTKDRDDRLEREQKRALEDPRVVRLSRRFVALRLSRSQHQDVLKDFGLPSSANMMMSFVTPDGQRLDDIGAGGIAMAESLAAKLAAVFKAYAHKVFETDVKPKLENPEATPADLKAALRLVDQLGMTFADKDLVGLLERGGLDQPTKGLVYDGLAGMSTKAAVEKLLELSRNQNVQATKALEKCTPAGAELLLGELSAEAETFDYALYKAITKICGIREVKPAKFFENAKPPFKQQELERVRKLVTEAAKRWKETRDEPG